MRSADYLHFSLISLGRHKLRSGLVLAATALGIVAVVVLTGLGEAARRFVADEFTALGTNLAIMLPGRNETTGGMPPMFGETSRDLTLDDAMSLYQSRMVKRVAPVNVGAVTISHGSRAREITMIGTTAEFFDVRKLALSSGQRLPAINPGHETPVCILGKAIRDELFGNEDVIGRFVRIGDYRFRVIGVLDSGGESLSLNIDEVVIVPVASAQSILNTPSVFRIMVEVKYRDDLQYIQSELVNIIRDRHDGEDDVTVITQDAVVDTFNTVFHALTIAVGGIAGISLLVAGVLTMNVSLVSVSQRTSEIGLLKALGATNETIRWLFVFEAGVLSIMGVLTGVFIGLVGLGVANQFTTSFQFWPPWWIVFPSAIFAVSISILFSIIPARKAANLDPVRALRAGK